MKSLDIPINVDGIDSYTKSETQDTELSIFSRHYSIPICAIVGLVGKTEKDTHRNICQFESAIIKLLLYRHASLDGTTLAIVDSDTLYRQIGHPIYGYNVIDNRFVMDSGQMVAIEKINKLVGFQKKSYKEIARSISEYTGWDENDVRTIAIEIWKVI